MGTADLPDAVAVGNTGHATWHEDIHDFVAGRVGATNAIDMGSNKITSLATPTAGSSDAATAAYAESVGGGGTVTLLTGAGPHTLTASHDFVLVDTTGQVSSVFVRVPDSTTLAAPHAWTVGAEGTQTVRVLAPAHASHPSTEADTFSDSSDEKVLSAQASITFAHKDEAGAGVVRLLNVLGTVT